MRQRFLAIVLVFAAMGLPEPAKAHRLDEYLQAARFSIERNRLDFEIDLTPGAAVAPQVFSLIDTNQDGRISEDEGHAYAEQLRRSIELSIDGVPVVLKLTPTQFPELAEMNAGTGMIRLHGTAEFPAVGPGRHALCYRNTHEPNISVYLSNALVPADKQVEVTAQHRDNAQDELIIDYRVAPDSHWPSPWWLLVAAPLAGVGAGFTPACKFKQKIRPSAAVSGEQSTDSAQRNVTETPPSAEGTAPGIAFRRR
jgi:hypothetical protein